MRACLSVLLLLIFSFQVLPAKKIGKLMGKLQGTEQVQDTSDTDDDTSCDMFAFGTDIIMSHASFDPHVTSFHLQSKVAIAIHRAGVLLHPLVTKIPAPPPEVLIHCSPLHTHVPSLLTHAHTGPCPLPSISYVSAGIEESSPEILCG